MNSNHTITLGNKPWAIPMRILTLINLFLGAFSMVQCIMVLLDYYNNYEISLPVVIIYLLVTPFAFVASLLFAFGTHWIIQGAGADNNIIFGYAMMILLAVDNLIYIPIHYEGAASLFILGAIELVCIIILFLYYQGWGNKALAVCGCALLILSFGYEMIEAIRTMNEQGMQLDYLYLLVVKVLNTLLGVVSLLFVFGFNTNIKVKE